MTMFEKRLVHWFLLLTISDELGALRCYQTFKNDFYECSDYQAVCLKEVYINGTEVRKCSKAEAYLAPGNCVRYPDKGVCENINSLYSRGGQPYVRYNGFDDQSQDNGYYYTFRNGESVRYDDQGRRIAPSSASAVTRNRDPSRLRGNAEPESGFLEDIGGCVMERCVCNNEDFCNSAQRFVPSLVFITGIFVNVLNVALSSCLSG